MARRKITDSDSIPTLPEDVPVTMPELPAQLLVTTSQQFKAIGDPTRSRILSIIQHHPATAKQLADTLSIAPGTIGHHLQVLESAGLALVVAKRLVHGIVAKYYTRTARIYKFDFPPEVRGNTSVCLNILTHARDELTETLTANGEEAFCKIGFPHARLSPERARVYEERLEALIMDFLQEQQDPDGQVYGMCNALFIAPPYLQSTHSTNIINDKTTD